MPGSAPQKQSQTPYINFRLFMMNGSNAFITLVAPALFAALLPLTAQAEKVTLTLSQEQDGGTAGRACMYIHQGQAEYRLVKPDEFCPGTLTIEATTPHA